MQPDSIYGSREYIQYVQPFVERAMQTYAGIIRAPRETEAQKYVRERMEAAMSILERIIGHDIEEELDREMERRENEAYHHGQNLMMAHHVWAKLRDYYHIDPEISLGHDGKPFIKPADPFWQSIRELLERFWTGD